MTPTLPSPASGGRGSSRGTESPLPRLRRRVEAGAVALADPLLWTAALFFALLFGMPALAPVFAWAFPGVSPPVFDRSSYFALFLSHAGIVATASAAATIIGVALAVFATRPAGQDFRPLIATLTITGQTFPPAAVLALAVPAIGFGPKPTLVALFLYGLLPIVQNAIAGLETVPRQVREAADGIGLSPRQRLYQVELPLAAPAILAGVRVSVTIAIGTATIGSTVGALTLGTPIFDGLAANKLPYVIQGAALVALFAILTDMAFARLERYLGTPS